MTKIRFDSRVRMVIIDVIGHLRVRGVDGMADHFQESLDRIKEGPTRLDWMIELSDLLQLIDRISVYVKSEPALADLDTKLSLRQKEHTFH